MKQPGFAWSVILLVSSYALQAGAHEVRVQYDTSASVSLDDAGRWCVVTLNPHTSQSEYLGAKRKCQATPEYATVYEVSR